MLIYNLYYTYKAPCSYIVTRLDYVFCFLYIHVLFNMLLALAGKQSVFIQESCFFFKALNDTWKSKVLAWGFTHFLKVSLMVNLFGQNRFIFWDAVT